MIRKLFSKEFNRADYMPRDADWGALFSTMGESLGSDDVKVFWYTINELEYYPGGYWRTMPTWLALKKLQKFDPIYKEMKRLPSKEARNKRVDEYKKKIAANRGKMKHRLIGWHELQDKMERDYPMIQVRRPGWQACSLIDTHLEQEKGVDVGMVVDMLEMIDEYDTALLISGDGDFVPAVKALRAKGKNVACLDFESLPKRPPVTVARRLTNEMDSIIDMEVAKLALFLQLKLEDDT